MNLQIISKYKESAFTHQLNALSNESKLLDAMGLTKDKVQIVMLCVTKGKVVVSVIKIPKSSPYYTTENWKTDSIDPNYAVPNYESDIKENSIRGDAKPTWTNAEETEFHGCT